MTLEQALDGIRGYEFKAAFEEVEFIRENSMEAIPLVLADAEMSLRKYYKEVKKDRYGNKKIPFVMNHFRLLGEFKYHGALETFIGLLEQEGVTPKIIVGDYKDFPFIIAAIALPDDLGKLMAVVHKRALCLYSRKVALRAISAMCACGKYPKSEFFSFLGALLSAFVKDREMLTEVAVECRRVYAKEHFASIAELINKGAIHPSGGSITLSDVTCDINYSAEKAFEIIKGRCQIDTIKAMQDELHETVPLSSDYLSPSCDSESQDLMRALEEIKYLKHKFALDEIKLIRQRRNEAEPLIAKSILEYLYSVKSIDPYELVVKPSH